ncbi:MAG: AEC family transporter [Clostridia bacterium]|nr:AEC family transporter [Clostridia bacterium]
MESLQLSFEAVMPIFLLMALGYLLKLLKFAEKSTFDAMNRLVFRIFLPILLFHNIYTTDLNLVFNGKLILFTVIGILTVFTVGYFVVLGLTRDNARRGVMLQGFFRSNYAILGIPVVEYVCGDSATGLASLMVAIVVPLFNILAVICLERFRNQRVKLGTLLLGIAKNPLVIGCLAGIVFLLLRVELPSFVDKAVGSAAQIASPLSMVILGAGFAFSGVRDYLREICITVSAKLILVPLLAVTAAALVGFRGEALVCVLVTFGAPVAVSSYSMSQQMGGDEKLAAQNVVISSALCLLTFFGWILVLDLLRLI